jgi:outer membrane receptor protein involved in Fe transport
MVRGLRLPTVAAVLLSIATHSHAEPVPEGEAPAEPAALLVRVRGTGGSAAAAKLSLLGTTSDGAEITREAVTDAAGEARIAVPSGTYSVAVDAEGHSTLVRDDVRVEAGRTAVAEIALAPAADGASAADAAAPNQLSGVTVHGRYTSGAQSLYLDERRSAAVVSEAIGIEQIARTGDTDVATTLKRVTGLSLVDGKYVYVRGLGERYSSVLLNGAPIPSPDYTRRVVPLDLFPTELLDGLVVQKGYSPDMPGEFGGGTVQLRTREVPRGFFFRLQGTLGYVDGTTGENGLRYAGGGEDWTGYDDGAREMPRSLAGAISGGRFLRPQSGVNPDGATPAELQRYGRDLAGLGYGIHPKSIGPDDGFSLGIGNGFRLADDVRLGVVSALRYNQGWDTAHEKRNVYAASNAGLSPVAAETVDDTQRNIDLGYFLGVGLDIGMNHRLGLTSMLLRQTDDRAKISDGTVDSVDSRFHEQKWLENQLHAEQLYGHHAFAQLHDLELDWRYTYAKAGREEPNTRRYRYDYAGDALEFSRRSDSNSQTFGDLGDLQRDYNVKAMLPFSFADGSTLALSAGAERIRRHRSAAIRTFTFQLAPGSTLPADDPGLFERPIDEILSPPNIGPDGFVLRETTRATDNYTAGQTLNAGFLNADFNLRGRYRLALGVRREQNRQNVTTFSIVNENAPPVVASDDSTHWLPAAAFTWIYSDRAQVRASFSRTLSRPDFRELSRAPFTDPELDIDTIGNPELRTTRIRNLDLRWEYYFADGSDVDSLSLGAFDKKFADPIERLRLPGSLPLLSFANASSAHAYGLEFELQKGLGFVERWWKGAGLEDFYVGLNYSRIRSNVELDAASASYQTNLSRPMQGQSPYIVNAQFGYLDPERGLEATLLFNRFGRRISQVGVQRQPDVYEESFDALDFQFRQRIGDSWRWSLRLRNLLDPRVRYTQGGLSTREYRRGREVLLSLEWLPTASPK